ncbi:endocuticle structural glycoprotein SgAbd-8 [Folsomia candida]|uniref:endocuticle structural glycoprotein SgAbd-8 n=1 Tax=Folsomia candida TaxID=158441 RepID=UPI000B8FD7A1|nr:endocuticle structural glycoprotein SgAbd-8 [Folsomia candida]
MKMLKIAQISLVVTIVLLEVVSGRPQPSLGAALSGGKAKEVSVLKDHREPLDAKGNYKYDIELSDGTKLAQEGRTDPPGPGETEGSLVVKGSYSYNSPDGTPVHVSYTADKDGFRPISDSHAT